MIALTEDGYSPKEFSKLVWFDTEIETLNFIKNNQIEGKPLKQSTYFLIIKY